MIKIITVGKVKSKELNNLTQYYLKQVPRKTLVIEIKDEANIEGMEKEGINILDKIKSDDFLITLEIEGKNLSSEEFSKKINELEIKGNNNIVFVIGGSFGLHDIVKKRSNYSLSFSKMTFPHQLMKLFLVEQIYRAYSILQNHPYHK